MENNNKIIQESVNDIVNNVPKYINVLHKNSFENILKYIGGLFIKDNIKNIAHY